METQNQEPLYILLPAITLLAFYFLEPWLCTRHLLSPWHALARVMFTAILKGRDCHHPHFIDEEIEARGESQDHTAGVCWTRGPSPGPAASALCSFFCPPCVRCLLLFSCIHADTLVLQRKPGNVFPFMFLLWNRNSDVSKCFSGKNALILHQPKS